MMCTEVFSNGIFSIDNIKRNMKCIYVMLEEKLFELSLKIIIYIYFLYLWKNIPFINKSYRFIK